MKPKKSTEVLTTLFKNRKPALIVGSPGVGKTEIVKVAAENAGQELIIFHPVTDDPTNYKGLPALVETADGAKAEFLPYGNLRQLQEAEKPVVAFFDDIGQSAQSTQAALMQLFLERKINGVKISDNVTFVSATNSRKDRAGVRGIITPLLSRFITIIKFETCLKDWTNWALENNQPPELIAFLRLRPELLHSFDPNAVGEDGDDLINQPCPRTIANLGELWNMDLRFDEILEGAVGKGFTTEFLGFIELIEQLGNLPQEIIEGKNPDLTEEQNNNPATLFALTSCLAHEPDPKSVKNIENWMENHLTEEFQMVWFKDVAQRHGEEFLIENGSFTKWAKRLSDWIDS